MSDSHGSVSNIFDAIEIEAPDVVLHLGDYAFDCNDAGLMFPDVMLRSVRGNSDRRSPGLDIDEFLMDNKRFFITHGHLFGVKISKISIAKEAVNRNADVVLFGHTHNPFYSYNDGIILLNPGSIGSGGKMYAVLELENGEVKHEFKHL